MKRSIPGFLFFLLVAALPCFAAGMNNKDVIKMQKAGLSEETILAAMQKETPDYDTSTDALIDLKSAGVSDKIIQKMITMKSGSAAPAEATGAPSADVAPAGSS